MYNKYNYACTYVACNIHAVFTAKYRPRTQLGRCINCAMSGNPLALNIEALECTPIMVTPLCHSLERKLKLSYGLHMNAHAYTHIHAHCTHAYTRTNTRTHRHMHTYARANTDVLTHARTYTRKHTHTCTRIELFTYCKCAHT